MSRSERLLDLIQILRRHRHPVAAQVLADEMGVSLRTVYRDVVTLQNQGASIDGEPGIGYVLRPGFMLPPLMFSDEEIEALSLGARFVATRGDDELARAAANALAKISAVLPPDLREFADAAALLVPGTDHVADMNAHLPVLREAIRAQKKVSMTYRDGAGGKTQRTIWPFAIGFFERVRIVAAWCELRQDFRSFRSDRIDAIEMKDARYPRSRQALLKDWRKQNNIPEPR